MNRERKKKRVPFKRLLGLAFLLSLLAVTDPGTFWAAAEDKEPVLKGQESAGHLQAADQWLVSGMPEASDQLTQLSPEQGIYELIPAADQDMCVDIRGCTVRDPQECASDPTIGRVQIYERLDVNQQKFYLERQTDGSFAIMNMAAGNALTAGEISQETAENGQQTERASLSCLPVKVSQTIESQVTEQGAEASGAADETETTEDVADDQKWSLQKEEDTGGWVIYAPNGLCLTCDTRRPCNQSGLSLQAYTGAKTQLWYFQKTRLSAQDSADTDHYNPYGEKGLCSKLKICIRYGQSTFPVDAQTACEWMKETQDHSYELDEESVTAYIQTLADENDTQGVPRTFVTHGGSSILLRKGNFGWKSDVEATAAQLTEMLLDGKSGVLEMVWAHTGAGFEKGNDIGDSYVEVSLEDQHLWLYIEGKEILSTDVVTGTYGTDRQTPGGVYSLTYKQSPAVLRGADYESPVTYWMPFNGGIGLHDATWRSEFGGDIFRTDGSHGCVNMPLEAAKTVYENVEEGFPIVLYN